MKTITLSDETYAACILALDFRREDCEAFSRAAEAIGDQDSADWWDRRARQAADALAEMRSGVTAEPSKFRDEPQT